MYNSLFECTSWDATPNMTKVKLELISDDMYLFFEKGVRGGVFTFLKHIVKPRTRI